MRYHSLLCAMFFALCVVQLNAQHTLTISANNTTWVDKNYTIAKSYFQAENTILDKEARKAKRLKITGLVFTGLGAAGILTTTPFVVIYKRVDGKSQSFGDVVAAVVGSCGYIPSLACLSVGIPLTITGYKKSKKQAIVHSGL